MGWADGRLPAYGRKGWLAVANPPSLNLRLFGLTCALFVGRTISCAVYVLTAKGIRSSTLGTECKHSLTSPIGIATQFQMMGLLVLLAHFDGTKILGGKAKRPR